jgi:imidazolonepropionase-like amidohydrolase
LRIRSSSLHRELGLLTQAGLANWDALAAATTTAGRFLDAPFGLQRGDRANLFVLDASLLDDVRHTQSVRHVIHQGRVVDRPALLDDAGSAPPSGSDDSRQNAERTPLNA